MPLHCCNDALSFCWALRVCNQGGPGKPLPHRSCESFQSLRQDKDDRLVAQAVQGSKQGNHSHAHAGTSAPLHRKPRGPLSVPKPPLSELAQKRVGAAARSPAPSPRATEARQRNNRFRALRAL